MPEPLQNKSTSLGLPDVPSGSSYCIVTDLDNTLVGNTAATVELNRKILDWAGQVRLIYATGRSYRSARELQAREDLLEPDYWITGVGSEIYQGEQRVTGWSTYLSHLWDRAVLLKIAKQVSRDIPGLIPQPEDTFNEHKISFYLYRDDAEQILEILRDRISQSGLAAQVIYSSNEDVDILPIRCDKGLATRYVMKQMGFKNHNTIVCGDSGNDIGLFKQETLGIVVGNARPELLTWCQQSCGESVYFARSGCAEGILEGLKHFGFT
jgi:sucrose-6-phosphatase